MSFKKVLSNTRGEAASLVILVSMIVVTLGILTGSQIIKQRVQTSTKAQLPFSCSVEVPPLPQLTGKTYTINGDVDGGSGNYTYTWKVVQGANSTLPYGIIESQLGSSIRWKAPSDMSLGTIGVARLDVKDNATNQTVFCQTALQLAPALSCTITVPALPYTPGETYTLTGNAQGGIGQYRYAWDVYKSSDATVTYGTWINPTAQTTQWTAPTNSNLGTLGTARLSVVDGGNNSATCQTVLQVNFSAPTATPTTTPVPPIATNTPTIPDISCTALTGSVSGDILNLDLSVKNGLNPFYYQIQRDGTKIAQGSSTNTSSATIAIANPVSGTYTAYVLNTQNGFYKTSNACKYIYVPNTNTPTLTSTPTIPTATPSTGADKPDLQIPQLNVSYVGPNSPIVTVSIKNERKVPVVYNPNTTLHQIKVQIFDGLALVCTSLNTADIPNLGVGATLPLPISLPVEVQPDCATFSPINGKTYNVTFTLDSTDVIPESNESNNARSINITYGGPSITLTPSVTLSPTTTVTPSITLTPTVTGSVTVTLSPTVNVSLSPTRIPVNCAKKSLGDADCQKDRNNVAINILDYAIWYSEFVKNCSAENIAGCGADADGNGDPMDANFNYPGTKYISTDTKVSVFDYAVWIQGFVTEAPPTATPTKPTTLTITPTRIPSISPVLSVTPPIGSVKGIWISKEEVKLREPVGEEWTSLVKIAERATVSGARISDQDSNHDVETLAMALVCVNQGKADMCTKAKAAVLSAINTEEGGRWLAVGRNLGAYIISADLLNLYADNDLNSPGSRVNAWLSKMYTRTLPSNNNSKVMHTFRQSAWNSGSNASAQEGFAYVSLSAYLKKSDGLEWSWNAYKRYVGDRTSTHYLTASDMTWQLYPSPRSTGAPAAQDAPVGIQDLGATKNGCRLDGAISNDMARGGTFSCTPAYTQYPWVGLEGAVPAAVVLQRAGYPAFAAGNNALLRAADYLWSIRQKTGDSDWFNGSRSNEIIHLINIAYNRSFILNKPVSGGGRTIDYTLWTHPTGL